MPKKIVRLTIKRIKLVFNLKLLGFFQIFFFLGLVRKFTGHIIMYKLNIK